MILQKSTDSNISYTLGTESPPTALSWILTDTQGVTLTSGSLATLPVTTAVSASTRRGASDDYDLTVTLEHGETLDQTIRSGVALLVTDSRGRTQDVLCVGATSTTVSVSGLAVESGDSVSSLWCPEVTLSIPGSALATVGDGYALHVTITETNTTQSDVIYFSVCPYHLQLPLSVRTYLDFYPALQIQLSNLSRRKDWSRLCDSARDLLESKLRASGIYLDLVAANTGLRRCLASALHVVIAPAYTPDSWKNDQGAYLDRCQREFDNSVDELLSFTRIDKNQDGKLDQSERTQSISVGRLRL